MASAVSEARDESTLNPFPEARTLPVKGPMGKPFTMLAIGKSRAAAAMLYISWCKSAWALAAKAPLSHCK